jgi:hypothetical protein
MQRTPVAEGVRRSRTAPVLRASGQDLVVARKFGERVQAATYRVLLGIHWPIGHPSDDRTQRPRVAWVGSCDALA